MIKISIQIPCNFYTNIFYYIEFLVKLNLYIYKYSVHLGVLYVYKLIELLESLL